MKSIAALIALTLLAPAVIAAESSKPEISLDQVVSDINKDNEYKIKDFISLVETKRDDEVSKAIKADKNHLLVNTKISGEHVLTYAIKNKMWKSAEALVKAGSNLNHKDKDGKVALMYAAEAKNKYLATMIKASKADKKIKDNAGVSAEEYLKKNGLL